MNKKNKGTPVPIQNDCSLKRKTTDDMVKSIVVDLIFTPHAKKRMKQRGIKIDFVEYALDWGAEEYEGKGLYKYFVSKRAVQKARKQGEDISCCQGLIVVTKMKEKTVVITVKWDWRSSGKGRK